MGFFDQQLLKKIYFREIIIILNGLIIEILQYKGIKIFGNTADIFDLLAYASGILIAMIFERFVLPKVQDQ